MAIESAEQYYNQGVACYKVGQYDIALEKYNKAITIDGLFSEAYNNRGYIYFLQGKYELAISDYKQAIIANPKNSQAYCNRAQSYATLQFFDDALNDYTKATELAPKLATAFAGRGSMLLKFQRFAEAMASLNIAVQLDPNLAFAYYYIGIGFIQQKQLLHAIPFLEKALQKGLVQAKTVLADIKSRLFFEADNDSKIEVALSVFTCTSLDELRELSKNYPYISHEIFRQYYFGMLPVLSDYTSLHQKKSYSDQIESWLQQLDQ